MPKAKLSNHLNLTERLLDEIKRLVKTKRSDVLPVLIVTAPSMQEVANLSKSVVSWCEGSDVGVTSFTAGHLDQNLQALLNSYQLKLPSAVFADLYVEDFPRQMMQQAAAIYAKALETLPPAEKNQPRVIHCAAEHGLSPQEVRILLEFIRFNLLSDISPRIVWVLTAVNPKEPLLSQLGQELTQTNPVWLPLTFHFGLAADIQQINQPSHGLSVSLAKVDDRSFSDHLKDLLYQGKAIESVAYIEACAQALQGNQESQAIRIKFLPLVALVTHELIKLSQFSNARQLLERYLPLFEQDSQPPHWPWVWQLYYGRARVFRYLADLPSCLSQVNILKEWQKTQLSTEQLARVASLEASVKFMQGNHVESQKLGERWGKNAEVSASIRVQHLLILGHSLRQQNQRKSALAVYDEALAIAQTQSYQAGIANALQSLAIGKRESNDFTTARDYLNRAMAQYRAFGNHEGELAVRLSLATLLHETLEFGAAFIEIRACEEGYQRLNHQRGLTEAMLVAGRILLGIGLRHEAQAKLRFAALLAQSLELKFTAMQAWWDVFQIELAAKNLVDAKLSLNQIERLNAPGKSEMDVAKLNLAEMILAWPTSNAHNEQRYLQDYLPQIRSLPAEEQIHWLMLAVHRAIDQAVLKTLVESLIATTSDATPLLRFQMLTLLVANQHKCSSWVPAELFEEQARYHRAVSDHLTAGHLTVFEQQVPTLATPDKSARLQLNLVANSQPMRELLKQLTNLRKSDSSIVIRGETGSGKEQMIRWLHQHGLRAGRALCIVDCASISENLFEPQFFGYEKGAFTGAHETKDGYFITANQGILVLDQVEALSLTHQAKLLRVLQEKEVCRVGSSNAMRIDVQVISTTQKDLLTQVNDGHFRFDLYYRLNVIELDVPPLRERREDLSDLISTVLLSLIKPGKLSFSEDAMQAMLKYQWPGNVRELRNEIERLLATRDPADESPRLVELKDLSESIRQADATGTPISQALQSMACDLACRNGFADTLEQIEKSILTKLYTRTEGNINRLARELNLPRSTLIGRLTKYALLDK